MRALAWVGVGAALLGALWLSRRASSALGGGDPEGNLGLGIGGTVGNPLLGGEPVSGKDAPKDTPENRTKDEFVLVKGNLDRARVAFDINPWNSDLARQTVRNFGAQYGLSFPFDYVYKIHLNAFPSLDPVIVAAVMENENAGHDPEIETLEANVGDRSVGLMQIRTATAQWMAPEYRGKTVDEVRVALKVPDVNIGIGMRYLYYQMARYSDPELWKLAPREAWILAAYNAGSVFFNFQTGTFANGEYVRRGLLAMNKYANTFPTRKGTGA